MKTPKVGEVWLVDSTYSWGQCLVEIAKIYEHCISGYVVDGEKDRYFEKSLLEHWSFTSADPLIRRVEA